MNLSTRKIVISGLLGAIAIFLGVTRLGFIPVPNLAGNATIMHVPAILGAVLEGPVVGILVGAIFGVFSFIQSSNALFADPLVAILPRLFIGLVAYVAYVGIKKINIPLALIVAGVLGSLTNTGLVLGMAVVRKYIPAGVAWGIAITNGIAEAVVAAIITVAIGLAVLKMRSGAVEAKGADSVPEKPE
ncbi:MAG: ECF transporter S component [Desulfitobacteriaceae bacterium]